MGSWFYEGGMGIFQTVVDMKSALERA